MARALSTPPQGFDELTVDEKIAYVGSLWELIAADPGGVPVPGWHRDILRERVQSHAENPDNVESWDRVRKRLERRLREVKE